MRGTLRTLAAGLVAIAILSPSPVAAQEPPRDEELEELIDAALDAEATFISPALANVSVDSIGYRQAFARHIYSLEALAAVTEARLNAEANLVELRGEDVRLTEDLGGAVSRKKDATIRLASIRVRIRELAVAGYMGGEGSLQSAEALDIAGVTRAEKRHVLVGTVSDDTRAEFDDTAAELGAAAADVATLRDERRTVRDLIARVTTDREAALAEEARLTREVVQREVELKRARVLAFVAGGDFALVTMDAYYRASRADPDCGLAWWGLAGIGKVESRHGQSHGATVHGNGDVSPAIIGIPLDGTNGTALIPDTDGGELDGDTVYDRAVGPMQFIPDTWARFAVDGDGDGDADPHNIYDATRAASAYLCRYAPLDDDEGLRRAYFAYNHSDSYVETVLTWSLRYAEILIPLV